MPDPFKTGSPGTQQGYSSQILPEWYADLEMVMAGMIPGEDPPPQDFSTAFDNALAHLGLGGLEVVNYDLYTRLKQQAWSDPGLQQIYLDPAHGNFTYLYSAIEQSLASPTKASQNLREAYVQAKQTMGVQLTAGERSLAPPGTGGPVVFPFPTKYYDPKYVSETFQQGDPGIDYAMPVGQALYAPFEGTVEVKTFAPGKGMQNAHTQGWGRQILIHLSNGWTFGIGHVGPGVQVHTGQTVTPGQILGVSGGDPNDPEGLGGFSSGPHIEVQWIDPQGHFRDPAAILQGISSGVSAETGYDARVDALYAPESGLFQKYFGRKPTLDEVLDIAGHGKTTKQMEDYIRSMASHIPAIAMGQYYDLRNLADQTSMSTLGHMATDGIVKDLFDKKLFTSNEVQAWYNLHGITGPSAVGASMPGAAGTGPGGTSGGMGDAAPADTSTQNTPAWQRPQVGPQ